MLMNTDLMVATCAQYGEMTPMFSWASPAPSSLVTRSRVVTASPVLARLSSPSASSSQPAPAPRVSSQVRGRSSRGSRPGVIHVIQGQIMGNTD